MEYKYYIDHILRRSLFYHYYKKLLEKTYKFSEEEMRNYKLKRLQKVILYSYKNVPYYNKLFDKIGICPEKINSLDELQKIPMMDKTIVKNNFQDLISKKCIGKLCKIETSSGTTGVPSKIMRDVHCVNFEQAALSRYWNKSGYNKERKVVLRGNDVVSSEIIEPPFWSINSIDNEMIMSSYHLTEKFSEIMIKKICEYKPKILYAYPSTAYLLAKIINKSNYNFTFDYIFTSSEMLMTNQRNFIENTFRCRIFDWYGQSERVSAISQCKDGHYHIVEDYSITELVETEFGQEVVGTTLFNYAMPLIRYRTGDIVEESKEKCKCGFKFRKIKSIKGRKISYIITNNGIYIPGNLLGSFLGKVDGIDEFQIIQEKKGEIVINIVINNSFKEDSIDFIKNDTNKRIGYDFKIFVKIMDKIPMGSNYKKSPFINKLMQNKKI
ncbi:MAG: hypothetical protein ABF289_14685 [Clostridiales bacterium]